MYKNGQFVKERLQTIKTKRVISPLTSRVVLGVFEMDHNCPRPPFDVSMRRPFLSALLGPLCSFIYVSPEEE